MKSALLIIALLSDGSMVVDAVYPMQNLVECENIASHQAVIGSYPDRVLICWEGQPQPPNQTWKAMEKSVRREQNP